MGKVEINNRLCMDYSIEGRLRVSHDFHLTLCERSALAILRQLRSEGHDLSRMPRTPLQSPCSGTNRWSRAVIRDRLARQGLTSVTDFSPIRPLHVAVPRAAARLQMRSIKSAVRARPLPDNAIIELGDGLSASSPELAFIEMADSMDPVVHLLLGMELTGRFSRSASDPRGGDVTYRLQPATTVDRLRTFAGQVRGIHGLDKARATIDRIEENAWSPMDALLAAMIVLPLSQLGYSLGPVSLNRRTTTSDNELSDAQSRVPDILFRGTSIGLNYDGEDHFGLQAIAQAGIRIGADPGNSELVHELDEAIATARKRIVEDKRRDRDLEAQGYSVMPVTKEDLFEPSRLDAIMLAMVDALEQAGGRHLNLQRRILEERVLSTQRQDLIWSLIPGPQAEVARRRLAAGPLEVERSIALAIWSTLDVEFPLFTLDEV